MVSNWARQDFPGARPRRARAGAVQHRRAREGLAVRPSGAGRDRRPVLRRRRGSPSTGNAEAGHNISLGHTAADYHATVLSFADECVAARKRQAQKPIWRPADARRIHWVGQPGRPDGAAHHRSRLSRRRCGRAGRRHSNRSPTPPAKVAESPAELAAASDLVCLCVVGDADVEEITGGEDGVLAGAQAGQRHRRAQHGAPQHLPRAGEKGWRARCLGYRRAGERWRPGGVAKAVCW